MTYQFQGNRYNVIIYPINYKPIKFNNAKLLQCEANFIVLQDEKGNEHIYTGSVGICIDKI